MKKYQIIKRTIGDAISEHGFKYMGADANSWTFLGESEGIKQYIRIEQDRWSHDQAQLVLVTDAYGIVPKTIDSGSFDNENEFIQLMEKFKETLLNGGFKVLEELSIPITTIYPTIDLYKELYQSHMELAKACKEKYQINDEESERILSNLVEILDTIETKDFERRKKDFLIIAAYIGDCIIIKEFGGYWEWTDCNTCVISDVKGKYGSNILNDTIAFWRLGLSDKIKGRYEFFKKY